MIFQEVWDKYCSRISGTGGRSDYAQILYEYSDMLPHNAIIVEIGTMQGASAICLAAPLQNRGGHIYTIDPGMLSKEEVAKDKERISTNDVLFAGNDTYAVVCGNIAKTEFKDMITPLPGFSEDVIKTWDKGVTIDMVYIDGCHQYEPFKKDMDWCKFLKVGGYLACDDWIIPVEQGFKEWIVEHPEVVLEEIKNGKYPKLFRRVR